MRDFQAIATVEALRSGVTSRHLAAIFSYGREALLERVERDLEEVSREGRPRALLLRGHFGEGKTHFLNLILNRAREKNFAVSFVVLSKETPFNRLDRVYPKVVAGTYLPGTEDPGIEVLLRDLRPGHPLTEDLLAAVREELHPKLFYVLKNYLATGDTYYQHLLYSDLAGEWIPLAQLKSLHRLNFGRPLKIPPFRPQADAWDYFRFLAQLIKKRGFAGWVILFDEFELVGTLGIAARSESYFNLARFLFPQEGKELPHTFAVFSIAQQLWDFRLLPQERHRPDKEEVTARFRTKGEPEKAERARQAIDALLRDVVDLNPLSSSEVQRMLSKVAEFHAQAYGWRPEVNLEELLQKLLNNPKAQRLRTKIRYTVEYLDLKYLYREEPEVEAGELEEGALKEAAVAGEEA
ncbi:BREX system ATP-binding domain-containing protein [Desulfothermobacter acidiphilus]|uniref:BREX system ATP-binding domain-containing protein n=1 Tax=Desulfothermobacter acidiphilus TaxID=1938353 RepID=UPI003F890C93